MSKRRIDIERLLQWAFREELPKGAPVGASEALRGGLLEHEAMPPQAAHAPWHEDTEKRGVILPDRSPPQTETMHRLPLKPQRRGPLGAPLITRPGSLAVKPDGVRTRARVA